MFAAKIKRSLAVIRLVCVQFGLSLDVYRIKQTYRPKKLIKHTLVVKDKGHLEIL